MKQEVLRKFTFKQFVYFLADVEGYPLQQFHEVVALATMAPREVQGKLRRHAINVLRNWEFYEYTVIMRLSMWCMLLYKKDREFFKILRRILREKRHNTASYQTKWLQLTGLYTKLGGKLTSQEIASLPYLLANQLKGNLLPFGMVRARGKSKT